MKTLTIICAKTCVLISLQLVILALTSAVHPEQAAVFNCRSCREFAVGVQDFRAQPTSSSPILWPKQSVHR